MAPHSLLLLYLSLLSALSTTTVRSARFTCTSRTTCQSLIGYVPVNTTPISQIQSLFGLNSLAPLLGFNDLSPSTNRNFPVHGNSTFRVPITCNCSAGSGVSNHQPTYTVQSGDSLDAIARGLFSQLVTFQEIAQANNISNPNLIQPGWELWIPLPCSCDQINEGQERVIHYAHVVENGSTVAAIAQEFGTAEATLLRLNDISSELLVGQILDVPLRACSSSISNSSFDSSLLLLPNGSSVLTANNCVNCSCDASDWQLKCRPSQHPSVTSWSTCPSMQCDGVAHIGETWNSSCGRSTCTYTGFNSQTILTQTTCPNEGTPGSRSSDNSSAVRSSGLQISKWIWIFISANLGLFSFSFFW